MILYKIFALSRHSYKILTKEIIYFRADGKKKHRIGYFFCELNLFTIDSSAILVSRLSSHLAISFLWILKYLAVIIHIFEKSPFKKQRMKKQFSFKIHLSTIFVCFFFFFLFFLISSHIIHLIKRVTAHSCFISFFLFPSFMN